MSESGLQMSEAQRQHFRFKATAVKGIYLLRRDSSAGVHLPRLQLSSSSLLTYQVAQA